MEILYWLGFYLIGCVVGFRSGLWWRDSSVPPPPPEPPRRIGF
jgi:hypothetical protein